MAAESTLPVGVPVEGKMVDPVDPLVMLQRHTISNQKVTWAEDFLDFDGHRVHRNSPCGFRLSEQDKCIDIGSVWYMLRETSADRSYTQDSAKKRGFKYIGVGLRSDLCDFLLGRATSCPGLVKEVVEGRKRPRGDPQLEKDLLEQGTASKKGKSAANTSCEISYADVTKRVRPVKDLDVLVRCPGRLVPNADLILKIAQDEWKNWHTRSADRRRGDGEDDTGKSPLYHELEENMRLDKSKKPIILVPCSKTAPVNLLNVLDLLQHGIYKRPDDEHMRFFESTRPESVEVSRNIKGKLWTFEIRDQAKNFSKAQWMRTVAIITDGFTWEFTGWPFESIVDMFTSIQGVYFLNPGLPMPVHINSWRVGVLPLAPIQLVHRFPQIRDDFFAQVEEFMDTFRQKKFVNHTTLNLGKQLIIKPKPIL